MKKIFTVSLVAIMAATAANADIASTKYVTDRTGNTTFTGSIAQSADLTVAVNALAGKVDTVAGNGQGSVADQITSALASYTNTAGMTGAITTAKQELTTEIGKVDDKADANAEAISKLDDKYATDTALTDGLALKQDVSNLAKAITQGMDKETTYPSVSLMETQIADKNNDVLQSLADVSATVNANETDIEGKVSALTNTVTTNKSAAETGIQEAKDAAAQALTDAKADATSKADKALADAKTYADAEDKKIEDSIGTVEQGKTVVGMIEEAKTAASTGASTALEAYKTTNDAAVAAAKKAGDDAQAAADKAQGEVDALEGVVATQKTELQKAISDGDAATLASAKEDATTKANAAQAAAEATAAADATTKANAALAEAKSYADTAEADAKTYGDNTFQVKSSALSVGAANGAWTDLTAAEGYSATGTHSLVLKNGVIQWEAVDYGDNQ